ncbi:MAG: hypothetical protein HC794_03260 [Nitrospiraceae bacterium]|nr:hypothetical protein [Nitrospiraceae bacterium]
MAGQRPQNPRAGFIQIELASTKFYRISDFIAGVMVCDGFETLFDVHLAPTKLPETALASEAEAIEFAADALRNNPNMTKEELKNALGRKFMVISDRRMQRVWAKARLMAGLSEFAKAGRKPGKSNR